MVDLLTLGEALGVAGTPPGVPLLIADQLRFSIAGAEATVAIGMARLGRTAAWVGTVGEDATGRRIVRELQAEGVETHCVRSVSGVPTGFMLRDHRSPDFVSVTYYRAGLAGSQLTAADAERGLAGYDHVGIIHLTGITPLLNAGCLDAVRRTVELARDRQIPLAFDVNYRSALADPSAAAPIMRELAASAEVLFVGDDELSLLTSQTDPHAAAEAIAELGPNEVVVKRGARGAFTLTAHGRTQLSGQPVAAIDVIGAGDSFVAGYLAARAEDRDITERLRWANVAGACTVGTHGDWEGLPTRQEIDVRGQLGVTLR